VAKTGNGSHFRQVRKKRAKGGEQHIRSVVWQDTVLVRQMGGAAGGKYQLFEGWGIPLEKSSLHYGGFSSFHSLGGETAAGGGTCS